MKKIVLAFALFTATPVVADTVSPAVGSESTALSKGSSTDSFFEGKPVLVAQAEPDAGIPAPPPTPGDPPPPAPEVKPSDKLHDPDAGVVIPPPPADSSQPPAPVVTAPSDKLHDPLSEPAATLDDIKQAKKQGWSFAILASIVILTATFARAAARWPSAFGWAAKHKYVIIVTAGVGSVAAAAYNALVLDGSWMAALLAAGGVLLSLITAKPAEAK